MGLYPDVVRVAVKKLGDRAALVAVGGWWIRISAAAAASAA